MSIFNMVYDELKAKIEHLPEYNTAIAKSVFNALDAENIQDIILDDASNTFWFETYTYSKGLNNKQHKWLVNELTNHGWQYLYN